ncbi:unnamed protein product [Prorocentrum cordatum]|uniref:Uncharacterized protein n=1 Tax=Prorocentrum cordatum TaxID=2364126 RepID=A0ABN9SPT9_9DINO|nr:unnamed protein product [Polarella glacialis]
MSRLSLVFALAAVRATLANVAVRANATVDVNQKVIIDGSEVYSQSSGFASLNTCGQFLRDAVNDASRPNIQVCGTSTKITVYLRNRCKKYYEYDLDLGTCNTGAASTTCVTASPATTSWLQAAQSYKITQC